MNNQHNHNSPKQSSIDVLDAVLADGSAHEGLPWTPRAKRLGKAAMWGTLGTAVAGMAFIAGHGVKNQIDQANANVDAYNHDSVTVVHDIQSGKITDGQVVTVTQSETTAWDTTAHLKDAAGNPIFVKPGQLSMGEVTDIMQEENGTSVYAEGEQLGLPSRDLTYTPPNSK